MPIAPLPISYRANLLRIIYQHLDAGKCGALYGVASSGKSRLVEFMGRPDVRQHYLGDTWTKILFPWVDGNDLLEHSEWGLCEKVLNAILTDTAQLPDQGGAARAKAEDWYWQLIRTDNKTLARRYLMFALEELSDYRIVLLLDEVEDYFAKAEELVFAGLRGLRDRFKRDYQYRVLYLLMSRHRPINWRETSSSAFDSFFELFKNFTYPIGCYEHDDACEMIRRLTEAYSLQRVVTPDIVEQLIDVTGGHAGLIDAAIHSGTELDWSRSIGMARVLFEVNGVWNECVSIYESLGEGNWSALEAVSNGRDPGQNATRILEDAGLVRRDARQLPRVIELLRLFVRRNAADEGPVIALNVDRRTVAVDGVSVRLDAREFELVNRLHQYGGQVCSYPDLFLCVYPTGAYRDDLRDNIRRLVENADEKVCRGCGKRIIIHMPGQGYRLIGTAAR